MNRYNGFIGTLEAQVMPQAGGSTSCRSRVLRIHYPNSKGWTVTSVNPSVTGT